MPSAAANQGLDQCLSCGRRWTAYTSSSPRTICDYCLGLQLAQERYSELAKTWSLGDPEPEEER